ncbi:MAG: tetratricopeptide repeat protein [Alphaproteobacteria bacterium]|nr:tetratricopeptide repeat protein [Alphaproteobacteria bacterium]
MKKMDFSLRTLFFCFAMMPHANAGENSWEYKDWSVSTDSETVLYSTNGNTIHGHKFRLIKQVGQCDRDLLLITWSTHEKGLENFKGSNAIFQFQIGNTWLQRESLLRLVGNLTPYLTLASFGLVADEKLISLLEKGHALEATIIAPEELAGKFDIPEDSFSLDGFIAAKLKSREFCEEFASRVRPLAEQGDAEVQFRLGFMYAKGQGVARDYSQAVEWFRKAAEQGLTKAQYNLGVMYHGGQGVAQDDVQAVKWWRKAAEQGDAEAQYNLGLAYRLGEGVAQDDAQAVEWYRKAAGQGDAVAQYNLGFMYAKGQGVARDYSQAVAWFRKVAEQGDADAQYTLGFMYANGQGVAQDWIQAVAWTRKAAEQGHAKAQRNLGLAYRHGEGVAENYMQAMVWLGRAAEQGDEKAQKSLDSMFDLAREALAGPKPRWKNGTDL